MRRRCRLLLIFDSCLWLSSIRANGYSPIVLPVRSSRRSVIHASRSKATNDGGSKKNETNPNQTKKEEEDRKFTKATTKRDFAIVVFVVFMACIWDQCAPIVTGFASNGSGKHCLSFQHDNNNNNNAHHSLILFLGRR
jgi:hypothetical protein